MFFVIKLPALSTQLSAIRHQLSANRCHWNWELATGNCPVPFLRARTGGAIVAGNSEAGGDSRRRSPGGCGFRRRGFRGLALPAAGVARRVGNRALGRPRQSQAARRRLGRGPALCRDVGAAARARTACSRGPGRRQESFRQSSGKAGIASKNVSGAISGIEAAARELRYDFFRQLAREGRVTKIATAHTLDDQAETVLLRIFRGTGIRGLSGIHPRIVFEEQGRAFGELVRPLLGFRRAALQEYLRERRQSWREDSSNRDIALLRNRVRHRLLPIIGEEFGESAIEHMAELAEIARAEEEHVGSGRWPVVQWPASIQYSIQYPGPCNRRRSQPCACRPAASLPVGPLLALPLAAQRRLARAWLEANAPAVSISFRLIEETLELARASLDRIARRIAR